MLANTPKSGFRDSVTQEPAEKQAPVTGAAETTRWQLSQTAFDRLLQAFDASREAAGKKYLRLRTNLIRFFEVRGLRLADEAADEVLNRLARKLEAGETPDDIFTYALGIARMIALEFRKSPLQHTYNELPEIPVAPVDGAAEQQSEKLKCLDECLGRLTGAKRRVIVDYYRGEKREKIENRRRLAEKLAIPQNALRSRAVRLRDRLEACILNCLRKL